MSMTVAFDTLDYARKLEKAGVPMLQAEQQSMVLAEVLGKAVASPNDLAEMNRSMNSKIDSSELKLESKIDKLDFKLSGEISLLRSEFNLVKWMLGTLMAINIAVALKLFLH